MEFHEMFHGIHQPEFMKFHEFHEIFMENSMKKIMKFSMKISMEFFMEFHGI
jgi:hypothetical protein